MSKVPFTDEQMELLRENPYTFRVTPSTLYLTREFKALFYEEYQSGKAPRDILEEHGYPVSILGNQRIWGITSTIKKQANRPEGFSEGSPSQPLQYRSPASEAGTKEEIHYLQTKVEYLRQEIEYLKKFPRSEIPGSRCLADERFFLCI